MATNDTQTNSRRSPAPPQSTSPVKNNTPPSHPPLQHDDPQCFRDYAHSIDFEDDAFFTDDMFTNPTPLPQLEISSIISAAEQLQQQVQSNLPARGTGLGKTESRPPKRVRIDTPQPDREGSRGDAAEGSLDGEGDRPQKRVRFDVPRVDDEQGSVDSVRESLSGEPVRPQRPSEEETQQAEHPGDQGGSSDDCAWSLDSGVGGGDGEEKAQHVNASSEHDWSIARQPE
ncbi:hypothetical protein MBLNU13_g05151t1 [Cladosporium sp. NU13]